ncbi:MAG: hypothetical protein JWQ04_590 [Pedosphaera sp.]|nr:hypothetical protein [Pedosphaera sp.]
MVRDVRLLAPAESAHHEYDKADHQNQPKSATAINRTAKVKTAAAEQKEQHDQ